jgi:hypothetical protein
MLLPQAQRTPEEEGDYLIFEQLVAEAAIKKEKETKKRGKEHKGEHPTTVEGAAGKEKTEV